MKYPALIACLLLLCMSCEKHVLEIIPVIKIEKDLSVYGADDIKYFSFPFGYKYTPAPFLPYHLMMAAFNFHLGERQGVRFYGSLFRYKYYMLYSNGELKPMVKIGDFGIAYFAYF